MKVIAEVNVDLPFKLDFCAKGPLIDPLHCAIGGVDVVVQFPPSLSETTDGQGIFGEWAWWTGRRLRVTMEMATSDVNDVEPLREQALTAGDEMLRRFLNAYRWRFHRPDVMPVRIDVRALELSEELEDGTLRALAEPSASFFFNHLPADPPLQSSVNATTLAALLRDVRENHEPPVSVQLQLDAEALDAQGEFLRADLLRGLARQQID